MKKNLLIIASIMMMLPLASCTKEGYARFQGSYSFKTSGIIETSPAAISGGSEGSSEGEDGTAAGGENDAAPEKQFVSIIPESGQMDIVTVNKSQDYMIVTMNIIGGGVVAFDAFADGNILKLSPVDRRISIPVNIIGGNSSAPVADVQVSGTGERYDDVLVFRLKYTGSYSFLDRKYDIVGSNVDCVAKLNR